MKTAISKLLTAHTKTFWLMIGLDVAVVGLHLLFSRQSAFFHLDLERNLPTYYQSFKLIGFGLFFLGVSFSSKIRLEVKSFMIPLALMLTFLGFDELFQIHENIYRIFEFFEWLHPSKIVDASMKMGYRSSLWILYYLPAMFLFVFWSGYWLRYFQSHMKSNFWIIGLSSACLFGVLVAEVLSSTGTYTENGYYWLVTLEETAEMLFVTTLVLVGNKVLKKEY